ncbi:MAG: entericidin A/B family lipoprotein [Alphaproteobacteria bacterium]|nr:entericidin A/B family lipoprotein [Alphaproteobacteria bacterium]
MRLFIALLLIGASLNLAACSNTAQGFGKDMEKAGEKIQKTF